MLTSADNLELDKACKLAKSIADEASLRMVKRFTSDLKIFNKANASDVVSELDQQIEQHVKQKVSEHFPSHSVLGEEFGGGIDQSKWLWIVDPIDGTQNYVKGIKFCCFSLAICFKGIPVFGIVVDPFQEDIYVARKGAGSTCNGKGISVRKGLGLQGSVILLELANGDPWSDFDMFTRNLSRKESTSRILGSSALSLAYVASGKADGVVLDEMNVWDIAAGTLLVEEAGGIVNTWRGERFQLFKGGGLYGGSQNVVQELLTLSQSSN